ncbi:unnamed protein product, partial [Rotaria sp. Silwood1]
MNDFDLDLIDELCSSFCMLSTSQNTDENDMKYVNESQIVSNHKHTS